MTSTLANETFDIGVTAVEWQVTDEAGNETTCSFDVEVLAYVSVDELAQIGVSLSPNPSNGIIRISSDADYKVEILNISGKMIKEFKVNSEIVTVNLSNESAGVYFVKFSNNEVSKTTKVIIK